MNFEVDNKIWQKDIETIANHKIVESFANSSVLITGATGLVGREIIFSLICANRIKGLNIKVFALVRNYQKACLIFKNILNNPNLKIIIQDIKDKITTLEKIDYIIHTSSVTQSEIMIKKPIEVIETTFLGTKNILEFANKNKNSKTIYLSSLEAYGVFEKNKEEIFEDDYGVLDSTIVRNCYPISKKAAENFCVCYGKQFGADIKIARLAQTFGPGISKDDKRVFFQFAKAIIKNEPIILKTNGQSYKNYCYLTDCVLGIFYVLLKGESTKVYNIANQNSAITIKDLANRLIEKYKTSSLKFEIDKNSPYFSNVYLKLNTKKLSNLGWQAEISLDEMFERLIEYLKSEGV